MNENQPSQPVPNEPASGEKYFPKAVLAKGSKDITILFSYDEWEAQ